MSQLVVSSSATPRWVTELQSPPAFKSKNPGIPDPPGFQSQALSGSNKAQSVTKKRDQPKDSKTAQRKPPPTPAEMDVLKLKKAWEVVVGVVKNLPMTAIMMYMTGNSLQIFSIMMVFMAFKNPIMGLLGTNEAFGRFETDTNKAKILQVKIAYVFMQFVALALGVWKVNAMGLLPTTRSDWLAWEAQREPLEFSVPAL